ncbi:haloacid dehalogenase type II [Curvivirga sp.]|uniref:haloacid dehalogenase type II n=1 Tax=Curvivirga sp. TaxID=2856848 RepID=UPI003B594F87
MNEPILKGIKACIFDAYGTLFNVHAAAAKCKDDLGDKADALSHIWRQKQLEYTWLRSLMRDYRDFWDITQDGLAYAMAAVNLDSPELKKKLLSLYWELEAYPEVPEMLSALRDKKLKRVILSNGSPKMLEAAAQSARITPLLNEIHSVDDIGVFKPDPRVYQMSVDHLYIQPHEICFVSSNAWDVAGAAHFGFNVVWVNRFNQPPEGLSGRPKAILKNLEKLPTLIG